MLIELLEKLLPEIKELQKLLRRFQTPLSEIYRVVGGNPDSIMGFLNRFDEDEYNSLLEETPELPDIVSDMDEIVEIVKFLRQQYENRQTEITLKEMMSFYLDDYRSLYDFVGTLGTYSIPFWIDYLKEIGE